MNTNSFWISTVPRTGSMWLYNITREILKLYKLNVLPTIVPQSDQVSYELYKKQGLNDQNNSNMFVFKIHNILKPNLPRSKILTTIRDPRDICISFKEFMRTDFNTSLNATKTLLKYEKTYKTYDKNYLKFFRYEKFESKTTETILKIAEFIGQKISLENAEEISLKYSKNRIKKLTKTNDENLLSKISKKEIIDRSKIVYLSKKNYRSFDTKTGFQTNHVSNRNSGDWKKIFSQKEIDIINHEFKDFLNKYKYI